MDGIVFTHHSPISLKYWDMLKNLNSTIKMELAAMLTTSLAYKENVDVEPVMTEEERKQELLSLAGCWADDPEDAARMEAAIKDGRKKCIYDLTGGQARCDQIKDPSFKSAADYERCSNKALEKIEAIKKSLKL